MSKATVANLPLAPRTHLFPEQLRRGEAGERWLDQHLADQFEIHPVSLEEQHRGIDRYYRSRRIEVVERPEAGDQVEHEDYGSGFVVDQQRDGRYLLVQFHGTSGGDELRGLPFPCPEYVVKRRPAAVPVEIKTSWETVKQGVAFVEIVSADRPTRREGWAYTSEAELLFYFLPQAGTVIVLPFVSLRGGLAGWLGSCERRTLKNSDWDSEVILVPLEDFEGVASHRLTVPPMHEPQRAAIRR